MVSKGESGHLVAVSNSAFEVRCTEEVLLPFFTDESVQAVMDKEQTPCPHSAPPLPELRLVLLGRKGAGKSSAGNTILGGVGVFESGKPTEECVKRRGDVAGRRVTVVDTPGWEWFYPLNSTPDWVRRETLRSVTLCTPGPHAVLLVVRSCASVTEAYTSQIEEHLHPLGEKVWDHTMVLFTRGDELGLVAMEQRIQTGGPAFQNLLRRCGQRYHVLNNRYKGEGSQVSDLMRKMEDMALRNEGEGHFRADMVFLGLEEDGKRRARERRKKQRQMEAQTQRGAIKAALMNDGSHSSELSGRQSFTKGSRRLPELRLVLLGEREVGKSSAGNTILGDVGVFQTGTVTEECVRQQKEVAMRLVTVVDAPGWERGVAGPTPERVKREVEGSVAMCPPGPHAVLLALRVDTLVSAGPVKEHMELLGEGVWRHTVLLFTHGDQLREGVGIEQHIQSGGKDLQWLVEKCGGRYHVFSNVDGRGRVGDAVQGEGTQGTVLLEKVEKMVSGNRCEAFSGLVQEVRELSRQRNQRFNHRLKELGDKVLRQEMDLKRIWEREAKNMRWFFDRKKKSKSPGKTEAVREEGEDGEKMSGERKNELGELEERMTWLTEDKEREIQDLSAENDRVIAALHQKSREREEVVMKLEDREREIDELKEMIDELQLKLLNLESVVAAKELDGRAREEEMKRRLQSQKGEAERLTQRIDLEEKEKGELIEKVKALKRELCDLNEKFGITILHLGREENRQLEQKEEEKAEIKEQCDKELKIMVRQKEEEIKEQCNKEMKIMVRQKEEEIKEQFDKEMEVKFRQKEEEIKEQCDKEMKLMVRQKKEEIKEQFNKEMEVKFRQKEEEIKEQLDKEMEVKFCQKEKEVKEQFNKEMELKFCQKEEEIKEQCVKEMKIMVRQKEEEIKEHCVKEMNIMVRKKEEEIKEQCDKEIKIMVRQKEEEIKEQLDKEMEVKFRQKEKEVEEQFNKEMEVKFCQKEEEIKEQCDKEMKLMVRQKEEEIKEQCEKEMEVKFRQKEKEVKDQFDKEMNMMVCQKEEEIKEQCNKELNIMVRKKEEEIKEQCDKEMNIMVRQKEEEIKEQCDKEMEVKFRQKEEEIKEQCGKDMKIMVRQKEEEIKEQLDKEMEVKFGQKEKEIKEQFNKEMELKFCQKEEEIKEQCVKEMKIMVRQKEEEIKEQCEKEMEVKFRQKEKEVKDQFDKEMNMMVCQKEEEIKEQCNKELNIMVRQKEEEIKEQCGKEMELKFRQKEEEIKEQCDKEMELKFRQKEEEIKEQCDKEMKAKVRQKEEEIKEQCGKEMEVMVQQKEEEIQEMKVYFAKESERKLIENAEAMECVTLHHNLAMESKLSEKEAMKLFHQADLERSTQERRGEVELLKLQIEKERDRMVNAIKKDVEGMKRQHQKEMEVAVQEKERAMEELRQQHDTDMDRTIQVIEEEKKVIIFKHNEEMGQKLKEKDEQIEGLKQLQRKELREQRQTAETQTEGMISQIEPHETKGRDELRQRADRDAGEISKLLARIDKKTEEIAQTHAILLKKETEIEEGKTKSAHYLEEIEQLKENSLSEILELQLQHTEREKERDKTLEKLQEKELEIGDLQQKNRENDDEISSLRQTIEQTKTALKDLTTNMEKEMTGIIQVYEGEIKRRDEKMEKVVEEMEGVLSQRQKTEVEVKRVILDMTERYQDSQSGVEELLDQNEKMRKEMDNLRQMLEEQQGCCETQRTKLASKDTEISALKDKIDSQERELETLIENHKNKLRTLKEMKEQFGQKLREKEGKLGSRDSEKEDTILKKEREINEKERNLQFTKDELNTRECELLIKQKELGKRESSLKTEILNLQKWEADLKIEFECCEKIEQDLKLREQNIGDRERDLENLCQELASKQQNKKEDLEHREKTHKNRSQDLENREFSLKSGENELLKWENNLEIQGKNLEAKLRRVNIRKTESISSDRHTLNGSCNKDMDEFHRQDPNSRACEVTQALDRIVMHQKVSAMDALGYASQGNRDLVDSNDLGGDTATSATLNDNCRLETLAKTDKREGDGRRANVNERAQREEAEWEVDEKKKDPRVTSPGLGSTNHNKDFQCSELRLLLLGESRSSRAPVGLTILGMEVSLPSGSPAWPWRGEIAGRQVSAVEPQGLSWRNGPGKSNAAQQQNLLDSLSQFNQRPHCVLLIIPSYLNFTQKYREAVEHHMSLLGEEIWSRTMVLFTWGDALGETPEQHVLRNSDLMWLIEKCESRYHVLYNKKNNHSQIKQLFDRIEETIVQNI